MRPRRSEEGAALLAILLLVVVIGAIAAAVLESLSLSRAAALNARLIDQGRFHAAGVEQLASLTIDDLIARSPERTTLAGGWNKAVRRYPMPDGSIAEIAVQDGGHCFNLNSLVDGDPRTALNRRQVGIGQFIALLRLQGLAEEEARRIAESAADWIDSDSVPGPGGAEDETYAGGESPYRAANTLFSDVGELKWVAGVDPEVLARLRPWLCALPAASLSPININTLAPEQAPLLVMLSGGALPLDDARRLIAQRPAAGWANPLEFWEAAGEAGDRVPLEAQLALKTRTEWFALEVRVQSGETLFSEGLLVDARLQPSRISARSWGN